MAVSNSTETFAASGVKLPVTPTASAPQHEKISCWFGAQSELDPTSLLGVRIRYATTFDARPDLGFALEDDGLAVSILGAGKVLAVLLAAPNSGESSSLLILQDGFSFPDFRSFDELTLLDILPNLAPAN